MKSTLTHVRFARPHEGKIHDSIPITHTTYYRCVGVPVVAHTNSPDVLPLLEFYLGKPLSNLPKDHAEAITVRVYVQVEDSTKPLSQPVSHLQDDQFVIVLNPSVGIAQGATGNITLYLAPSHLTNPLSAGRMTFERLFNYVLVRHPYLYPLHAAAVGIGSRMAVLVGERNVGKSTLAYACLRRGMHFLSDDLVVRHANDGPFAIRGQGRWVYLEPKLSQCFPELEEDRLRFPKWRKFRVDVHRLYTSQSRSEGTLAAFVLLRQGSRERPSAHHTLGDEVVASLKTHATLFRRPNEQGWIEATLADLERLSGTLPSYTLELSNDHERNAALVQELLEGVR
ncbi:MAG: hypothetical protein KatS3mg070_2297 [Meiothermus sp.]|uniref:hypothetical protein n=1 Tax=Meiothermus sp. TaxID=1955249 RepID=UPI0021DBCF7C|nr:hypothetical protein [Meiothermus sp.]GIW28934.1 MAG: hypothetical protein KatS3mg070_2297 [Meiothermus sp.]